ncbi:hypothetical protein [Streptomyces sp. NBC_01615]|uniref:hypothetical protein n=1 Tax=Streptomyces sp. NBC_01615 TaxID=2975898 RepID=UPI0038637FAD
MPEGTTHLARLRTRMLATAYYNADFWTQRTGLLHRPGRGRLPIQANMANVPFNLANNWPRLSQPPANSRTPRRTRPGFAMISGTPSP